MDRADRGNCGFDHVLDLGFECTGNLARGSCRSVDVASTRGAFMVVHIRAVLPALDRCSTWGVDVDWGLTWLGALARGTPLDG